jgi:hypothetical protein
MKKLAFLLIFALLLAVSGCAGTPAASPATSPDNSSPPASSVAPSAQAASGSNSPGVTISTNGEHTLTGAIDGQVLVTAANVTLVLDGATITCADGSAILGDDGNGQKAMQELTIRLVGNSSVSGGAHGIQGKDNLTITGDGSLDVTAVKDGLHAGDALNFVSGTVNVLSSYEGVEAAYVNLIGGSLTTHASDDGVNAASDEEGVTPSVLISGGTHFIYAGSDGIDSNGTLDITGGSTAVLIYAPRDGETFDADRPGAITPTLSFSGQLAAGDTIGVTGANGETLFETTLDTAITSASLALAGLVDGETYGITQNGAAYRDVAASTAISPGMGGGRPPGEFLPPGEGVPPGEFVPPRGHGGRGGAPINN